MNDLTVIYLIFLLSVFCACVVLIAVSCFWDCFKAEIMQARLSKRPTVDFNEEKDVEEIE